MNTFVRGGQCKTTVEVEQLCVVRTFQVCSNKDENCGNFAAAVLRFLTDDPEMNREDLDKKKFCQVHVKRSLTNEFFVFVSRM